MENDIFHYKTNYFNLALPFSLVIAEFMLECPRPFPSDSDSNSSQLVSLLHLSQVSLAKVNLKK